MTTALKDFVRLVDVEKVEDREYVFLREHDDELHPVTIWTGYMSPIGVKPLRAMSADGQWRMLTHTSQDVWCISAEKLYRILKERT